MTSFKIYINDSLIDSFSCETNYSINRCLIDNDNSADFGDFDLNLNSFSSNDQLVVQANDEILLLNLNDSMKKYNRLRIGKYNEEWHFAFDNSSQMIMLE